MNILQDILPAVWRKRVYALYAVAGAVVLSLGIAGVDLGRVPEALVAFGTALGLTAASNTPGTVNVSLDHPARQGLKDEQGHGGLDLLIVATFVGVLLLLLGVTLR